MTEASHARNVAFTASGCSIVSMCPQRGTITSSARGQSAAISRDFSGRRQLVLFPAHHEHRALQQRQVRARIGPPDHRAVLADQLAGAGFQHEPEVGIDQRPVFCMLRMERKAHIGLR